jgi:hypothetical protein
MSWSSSLGRGEAFAEPTAKAGASCDISPFGDSTTRAIAEPGSNSMHFIDECLDYRT